MAPSPTTTVVAQPDGPPQAHDAYRRHAATLAADYARLPPGAPVRLAKRTSNLFRSRARTSVPGLDVSAFSDVISIDPVGRSADVGAMTTYERLVDATLAHGLMPCVVPQLKTITVGGAVTGLGIESSSWRNGLVHESVQEIDILTGDGRIITARPDNEHRALFFGFPNSYGTLGYALRVRIELEAARPYVHLRHLRFDTVDELAGAVHKLCGSGAHEGEPVAFIDGTVFGPEESYLTLGSWSDSAPRLSDYTHTEIYYRSLQTGHEDWLSARDYLWRWDTDWFWCSRAFGAQRPWVRRLVGPRFLRSSVYWKMAAFEERYHAKATLDRWRGLPARESVIQDIEIPVGRLAEFLADFDRNLEIAPLWLCPLRQRDATLAWDLYRLDPDQLYVNVGLWSTVALAPGMEPTHHNRWVEDEVDRLGGRKSLYSTSCYDEATFWRLYNGPVYRELKGTYDPSGRLLDLFAKCVQAR